MDRVYAGFVQALEKTQNWKVLSLQTMVQNPGYKEAYKKIMEGWQQKMPAGFGTNDYFVQSVMDWNGPRLLDFDGREKLMVDLGVDAIVMLKVDISLKGFTVAGVGERRPQARAHVEVHGKGTEKIIWFDTFDGKESTESVGLTG